MSVKTSWEDIEIMGVTKQDAFLTFNALRGDTMTDESQMHLNNSFVEPYLWFCYNKITGNPILTETVPSTVPHAPRVVYTWDNTLGTEILVETRSESISHTVGTTLSKKTYPKIKLGQTITVADVAGSGNSLMLDSDSGPGTSAHKEEIMRFEATFKATVPPGEKVELVMTETRLGNKATYQVPYAIQGLVGTEGEIFDGHRDWGFITQHLGPTLTSSYELTGSYSHYSINYELIRVSGTGEVKSRVVYVSPSGPEHNIGLEIYDGKIPDGPKSGGVGIPGF